MLIEAVPSRKLYVLQPSSKQSCKVHKSDMVEPYDTKELERRAEGEERHIDPNKAHREDLCSRCKGGKPCRFA